ncbi:glycoside hydrolase family 37 protein [Mycena olivaceomarginata]|nr:glycoside hydrolase family 37 protein [Mycena olivaceomarginata]
MRAAFLITPSSRAGATAPPLQSTVSQIVVTTATATPSPSAGAPLPSQAIFCAGPLLQTINLANPFVDPKTIVDKYAVLADFAALPGNASLTEGAVRFVDADFAGEGQELVAVPLPGFQPAPRFLQNVTDPLLQAFAGTVHGFWTQLVRGTNASALCDGVRCESSLVPLNQYYYWDSFWIVEGLLESELYSTANDTLQNFMDEIERFGFIPNGGRIYYLDRSQPPLFIQMLARYVAASNDTAILKRALPLAERELTWWQTHTAPSTSPAPSPTPRTPSRTTPSRTAPRARVVPQDYATVHDPAQPALNDSQAAALYAELASGAETGRLNVRGTVPVCLNSIFLYGKANATAAARHTAAAAAIKAGVLDLFWNATKLAFYDFNLASNTRNDVFSAATFYPFWSGIIPPEVSRARRTPSARSRRDAPNAWPPHQYVALQALRALPANVTVALPTPAAGAGAFSLVPRAIGVDEAALPVQALSASSNASTAGARRTSARAARGVVNGGNATGAAGWADALGVQLANRYVAGRCAAGACACGYYKGEADEAGVWHATGGQIPGLLPRLSDAELNVTQSTTNTGNMFEKFSMSDIDSAGRGGEYTVQAGFGNYGGALVAPECPRCLRSRRAASSSAAPSGTGSASASAAGPSTSTTGAARGLGAPSMHAVGPRGLVDEVRVLGG